MLKGKGRQLPRLPCVEVPKEEEEIKENEKISGLEKREG